jgi:hypothetical protein
MNSQALDKFMKNKVVFTDLIDLTHQVPAEKREMVMRMLVVSLVAFWEAFHEDLCREVLPRNPNATTKAQKAIRKFHNPNSGNIKNLYNDVLQISDITAAWWGKPSDRTGQTPQQLCSIIDRMMELRHDTAHGVWQAPISAPDCMDFLSTTVMLAMCIDDQVASRFP